MNENELQRKTCMASEISADMERQSPAEVSAAEVSPADTDAVVNAGPGTNVGAGTGVNANAYASAGSGANANADAAATDMVKKAPKEFAEANTGRVGNEKTLNSGFEALTDGTTQREVTATHAVDRTPQNEAAATHAVDRTPQNEAAATHAVDGPPQREPVAAAQIMERVPLPHRDYEAEWMELAKVHPEVVGTTLPEDIFQACIRSDQPPLRVYESMMLQRMQGELARLKQENDRLRQNHDNAQRAPVTGTLEGGATGVKEEDAFIAAFKRYR